MAAVIVVALQLIGLAEPALEQEEGDAEATQADFAAVDPPAVAHNALAHLSLIIH